MSKLLAGIIGIFLFVPFACSAPNLAVSGDLIFIQDNSLVKSYLWAFDNELEVQLWEMANTYSVSYEKMWQLVDCESKWKTEAWGDNHTSFGLLQFKEYTFNAYKKEYGHYEFQRDNPYDQISLACEMVSKGEEENWKNCWNLID